MPAAVQAGSAPPASAQTGRSITFGSVTSGFEVPSRKPKWLRRVDALSQRVSLPGKGSVSLHH